ncbi:MAG: hypothetical protein JNM84_26300 [Planctomycetes bacterium]|nr:hypothetical protein [Planctomycetota bacterium]
MLLFLLLFSLWASTGAPSFFEQSPPLISEASSASGNSSQAPPALVPDGGIADRRDSRRQSVSGGIAWEDGMPAVGVEIRLGGKDSMLLATSDEFGGFAIDEDLLGDWDGRSLSAMFRAPCWQRDREIPLTISGHALGPDAEASLRRSQWDPVVLPLELDLKVDLRCEAEVWKKLEGCGYRRAEARIMTGGGSALARAMSKPLVEFALHSVGGGFEGTSTVPLIPELELVAFLRGEFIGSSIQSMLRVPVATSRSALVVAKSSIEARMLIAGSVVDQKGSPLSEVSLEIVEAGLDGSPPRKDAVALDPRGRFAYFGGGASSASVLHHSGEGTRAILENVPFGTLDLRIEIDLSTHREFRLQRKGAPICEYRLGAPPTIFHESASAALPWHEGGSSWWPRSRGKDLGPILLVWNEGGVRYIEAISLPPAGADGVHALDAEEVTSIPTGMIRVSCGELFRDQNAVVTARRVEPAAPPYSGYDIQVQRARGPSGVVEIPGLPPGWYEVEVGVPVLRGPGSLKQRCELKGGTVELSF